MEPVSIYIHIPFCKKKCNYCDFLSFANKENEIDSYLNALILEIKSYKNILKDNLIKTVFIGGGTPSILSTHHIQSLIDELYNNFKIYSNAEITIECNPESITKEKLIIYKRLGINRVSLGLQATENKYLEHLGRIHSYSQFYKSYHTLRELGYDNINVDLMFGLPNQSLFEWKKTIKEIIKLDVEHISTYGLIIEEGTPYYNAFHQKKWDLPSDEEERNMYWYANEELCNNGYEHYEISNYSKKGYSCKHNLVYWTLGQYIGMGIGAASFYNGFRMENVKNINDYINFKGDLKRIITSKHFSSIKELKEEFIFLGLRLINGISKEDYFNKFHDTLNSDYNEIIKNLIKDKLLIEKNNHLHLTKKGIDISNYVLAKFIK